MEELGFSSLEKRQWSGERAAFFQRVIKKKAKIFLWSSQSVGYGMLIVSLMGSHYGLH